MAITRNQHINKYTFFKIPYHQDTLITIKLYLILLNYGPFPKQHVLHITQRKNTGFEEFLILEDML